MLPRVKFRQGYSLDELRFGALSDSGSDDDADDDDQVSMTNVRAVEDPNARTISATQQGQSESGATTEDWVSEDAIDADNEKWVTDHFESGITGDKTTLCCPGCFTPICFVAKFSERGFWESSRVVNCIVKPIQFSVDLIECAECGCRVGRRANSSANYYLDMALPSSVLEHM